MAIIFRGSRIAGTGKPGESAYEAAKKSGYEGTEEEFAAQMNDATNFDEFLTNHNLDENAHPFILDLIDEKIEAIPTYATEEYVNGQIDTINTEIDTLKTSVSEGKTLIAAAVTDKGVETAADDTFAVMAANISNIPTGTSYAGTLVHSHAFEYMMGLYGIRSIYNNYLK